MYQANPDRYHSMQYNRCGKSGILLPPVSLGFWHNFGSAANYQNCKEMTCGAFDLGITHFDLANNYGPVPGSAEEMFGTIMKKELRPYRDEMIISSKAGYTMWDGPYGDWGSKKYLISSLDQSLKRMGLEYVDVFYHHRPDPNTPIQETVEALKQIVTSGKALYIAISNYNAAQTAEIVKEFDRQNLHCLLHQMSYSMFNRAPEDGVFDVLEEQGIGAITFSSLAQGMLTNKYFNGIPADCRANDTGSFLKADNVTAEKVQKAKQLDKIAADRGQSLAEMALTWCQRKSPVVSTIIGARNLDQIKQNVKILDAAPLTTAELTAIDAILAD